MKEDFETHDKVMTFLREREQEHAKWMEKMAAKRDLVEPGEVLGLLKRNADVESTELASRRKPTSLGEMQNRVFKEGGSKVDNKYNPYRNASQELYGDNRRCSYDTRGQDGPSREWLQSLKVFNDEPAPPEGLAADFMNHDLEEVQLTETEMKELEREMKADMVNQPPHYMVGGIEVADFIDAKGLNHHLSSAIEYICRAPHKGTYVQDLEKAIWRLRREIMVHEGTVK